MKMYELQKIWLRGGIEKKAYWTLMRENYTHILPEIQEMLRGSLDCESVSISPNGCILKKTNGVRLYFDFTQAMCRAEIDLVMGVDSEKDNMEFVERFLAENERGSVLDIGANVGLYSLSLYQSNKEIIYHVFEPIPATYEKLTATARLNETDSQHYIMHNLGFSNEQGTREFYLPAANEAASLRMPEDDFYKKKSTAMGEYTGSYDVERVTCKIDTVDHFVMQHDIKGIGFMKIDVEGNEKFVLEGAVDTIRREKPLIYCELLRKHAKRFGYHPNDVIGQMKEWGYRCTTMQNRKLVTIKTVDEETLETNFFFLHHKKHRGILAACAESDKWFGQ